MSDTGELAMATAPGDEGVALAAPTERSIAFSVEELVALSRISGIRLPLLGPNPLSHVRLAERSTVLDIANRSLRARDVVAGSGDAATVADPVLGLLAIIGASALRAEAVVDHGRTFLRRYHCVPYASVEHQDDDGVHRFTPFATIDLLARIARQVGLARRPTFDAPPVRCPYGVLQAAREAHDPTAAAAVFAEAELEVDAAMLAALVQGGSVVAVRLTRQVGPTRVEGGELAWLDAGERGLWLLPAVDQPFAMRQPTGGVDDADGAIDDGLASLEVEVAATDADTIAERLFSHLPEAG